MANDCSDGASHHILTLTNNDGSPQSRTHNLQNQVIAVGGANLSFDANGNMTVDEQGRTFIWDAWNRLVEVKQGSTTLVEYQYDGLKRRIVEDDGTSERHLLDHWSLDGEQSLLMDYTQRFSLEHSLLIMFRQEVQIAILLNARKTV